MQALVDSGRLIDLILLGMVVEAAVLLRWRQRSGRGVPALDLALYLAAGVALMVALRLALTGAAWPWLALALATGGALHAIDLARRWRRAAAQRIG